VTMPPVSPPTARRSLGAIRHPLLRVLLAALLGAFAALLISCSSSGKGLIPIADAGPLRGDFRAVAQAAENGDGSCAATESALLKTEQDFAALPSSTDSGLRDTLRRGVENLRTRALALCAQPLPQATETTSAPTTSTTDTTTTPTVTQTTSTQTTPTTTPTTSGPGGGTPAPGAEGEEEASGLGKGEGAGKGHDGGTGPGGGASNPEAGK
jgi:hypothetical protein